MSVVSLSICLSPVTRLVQNSSNPPRKSSRVERLTNKLTLTVWLVQTLMCMAMAIGHAYLRFGENFRSRTYLGEPTDELSRVAVGKRTSLLSRFRFCSTACPSLSLSVCVRSKVAIRGSVVAITQGPAVACRLTTGRQLCTGVEERRENKVIHMYICMYVYRRACICVCEYVLHPSSFSLRLSVFTVGFAS